MPKLGKEAKGLKHYQIGPYHVWAKTRKATVEKLKKHLGI